MWSQIFCCLISWFYIVIYDCKKYLSLYVTGRRIAYLFKLDRAEKHLKTNPLFHFFSVPQFDSYDLMISKDCPLQYFLRCRWIRNKTWDNDIECDSVYPQADNIHFTGTLISTLLLIFIPLSPFPPNSSVISDSCCGGNTRSCVW